MRLDYVTQTQMNILENAKLSALRTQDMVTRTQSMFGLTENLFDSMWGLWYKKPTNNDKPPIARTA